jgi:hypothetical protein
MQRREEWRETAGHHRRAQYERGMNVGADSQWAM